MANTRKKESARDGCSQETRRLKMEVKRIMYEMEMCGVEKEVLCEVLFKEASEELKDFIVERYIPREWNCEQLVRDLENQLKVSVELENERKLHEELLERVVMESRKEMEKKFYQKDFVRARMRTRVYLRKHELRCYKCGIEGHIIAECDLNRAVSREKVREAPKYRKVVDVGEDDHREELIKQLNERHGEVTKESGRVRYCKLEKCRIQTEEGSRVVKKGQRVHQALFKKTKDHIYNLLDKGIIRRSESDWRNPIRAIEKPNGDVRLVSNFIALNDLVKKDPYELVNIRDVIRATQGSKYFTVVDLKEAFYHIEIEEEDKFKTAFEFEGEVFEWNSMVMGFKNSPQIMQRVMSKILGNMKGKGVEVYMDDIVIHAKRRLDHDSLLDEVFKRLKENNMKVNVKKLQLCQNNVKLLGVNIDGTSMSACDIKKNEALEYATPTSVTEVRRFLGLTGWFRNFIKDYARLTHNLTDSLKKKSGWTWTDSMNKEFVELKEVMRNLKSLVLPNYNQGFMLRTDASNTGIGAVLLQEDDQGRWVPVQWASKKLTPTETRYGISEKEMYAVFWGIKKFEYELRGRKFRLVTDHKALEEIRRKPYFSNNRINRWVEKIQEFDFTAEYQKGEELAAPDALSRLYEKDEKKAIVVRTHGDKIKARKWSKHTTDRGDMKFWRFDDGREVEIPGIDRRKELVKKAHNKTNHKGVEAVYYEMKNKWYRPGIKETIINVIKKCEVCQINNRKTLGGCDYIATSRWMEKLALDIMYIEEENQYVLVAIDYFTRIIGVVPIPDKSARTIIQCLEKWIERGIKPDEIITDNGKEFVNEEMRKYLIDREIKHNKVGVESHRSNGRVERAIRTIRDGLIKNQTGTILERLDVVLKKYNNSYHSGIKCTPSEAFRDSTGKAMIENSCKGRYAKQFKRRFREEFRVGQKVRVTQRDNLGRSAKGVRGRFVRLGIIIDIFKGDSYLVRMEDGKIRKKRHYDLKGLLEDN